MRNTWLIVLLAISCEARPGRVRTRGRHEEQPTRGIIDFFAYRTELIESPPAHKPLLFDGLHFNNGGHYDLANGYFTSPHSGLYVFNFTSYDAVENRLRLMKNDYEVRMLSKDGKSYSNKTSDSNILLQLDKGDRVWLRVAHARHNRVQSEENSILTTFSGKLLTTDVNIDIREPSSGRHKRSPEVSLKRMIREANFMPVSLVWSSNQRNSDANTSESTALTRRIAFSVTCTKSMIGGHMADTTASLDGEMSPEAAPNGRIGFDKTFVNIGNGFDLEKAEFVAPVHGVYYFSFNVGKFPKKKLSVMLMKNFNEVQSIIYNDSRNKAREVQGQSLMLDLQEGDRIWLRSYNGKDYAVYSNFGNYITFNGYLVFTL